MEDDTFGRHLLIARLRRGFTQAELAQASGLSARCISDLERGLNAAPRLSTLQRLIDGLDLGPREARELRDAAALARVEARFGQGAARNAASGPRHRARPGRSVTA